MHPHLIAAAASGSHSALGSPFMQVLVVVALIFGIYCLATARKS